ncbi:hypothetical protein ANN_14115 [Periplaneta americana]|uniref:Histone-lysine N-methyltransferase SETMAR n=1 Tax=Periplaneta americana TaxID=6978 RepID=A0ABQ8SVE7_PERAM|nr:hypothetical protein ANN_14115 [Periplaneta americana]
MLNPGVIFLHDNARPHTARRTATKLQEFNWKVLDHPPCSPDFAPSDYHLFMHMKTWLGSKRFDDDEELKTSVLQVDQEDMADLVPGSDYRWHLSAGTAHTQRNRTLRFMDTNNLGASGNVVRVRQKRTPWSAEGAARRGDETTVAAARRDYINNIIVVLAITTPTIITTTNITSTGTVQVVALLSADPELRSDRILDLISPNIISL